MPEIWTSRITTSSLTGLFKQSEGQLVNAYLEKNHAYRTDQVVFPKQAYLFDINAIIADNALRKETFNETKTIFESQKYPLSFSPATELNEFFSVLEHPYEIVFWGRHGMETYIQLGKEHLTSEILASVPVHITTAFVFPISCWIGHYVEPNYFAGSYIFNTKFFALAMPTATLPIYAELLHKVLEKFIQGMNLGLAFKKSIETPDSSIYDFSSGPISPYLNSRIASSNSRFILGDGTLKLQSANLVEDQNEISPTEYLEQKYPQKKEDSSIFEVIRFKLPGLVKLYVEHGADINAIDKFGRTTIVKAIYNDDLKMVKILLENGANINIQDSLGRTPLHLAALYVNIESIKLLINNGADINAQDNSGNTALHLAIENGDIEIIKLLIDNGADLNIVNKDGSTPLVEAVYKGDPKIVKVLLENGADLNAIKEEQFYSLMKIVGDIELIKALIKNGADLKAIEEHRTTPLIQAIGDIELVKALIKNGIDVNAQENYYGNTLLHHAVDKNNIKLIKLLIDNGANVNITNNNARTPLHHAIINNNYSNYYDVIKFLVDNGANVNDPDKYGNTPLRFAYRDIDVIKLLINNGADINAQDDFGNNLFHIAIENEDTEIIKLLINNGADVNAKTNEGLTPYNLSKDPEIKEILENAGAKSGSELQKEN